MDGASKTFAYLFTLFTNSTLEALESPTERHFSSPYYPNGFPINITCGWYITAPENHTIKVQIKSGLRSSSSSKDSVEVYDVDGSELSAITIDFNPYENTDTVYSKFHKVYVLFKSDDQPQIFSKGIFVSYTAMKTGKPDHISSSCDCSGNALLDNKLSFNFCRESRGGDVTQNDFECNIIALKLLTRKKLLR